MSTPQSAAPPILADMLAALPWLQDAAVEEVCLNRPGEAFVLARGEWTRHAAPLDLDDLIDLAVLAGACRRQDIDPARPLLSVEIHVPQQGRLRLQAVIPPAVPEGTASLTFRRAGSHVHGLASVLDRYDTSGWNTWSSTRRARWDRADLLSLYDSGDLVGFLHAAVVNRLNILLVGATGAGKTTLSETLLTALPARERILTIEDTLELAITNPNAVRLLYSKGAQGETAVTVQELLEAGMRMRPDRLIVGELRDPEPAWTYVNQAMTGHPGSITTVHGATAADGARRIYALAGSAAACEDDKLRMLMRDVVDLVIPCQLSPQTGRRVIREVWFSEEAARRGRSFIDLVQDA